jgi:uncharacterized protein YkwD
LVLLVSWPAQAASLHAVVRNWSKINGITSPARDGRLDRVARGNSEALAEIEGPAPSGASTYLRFLLEKEKVHDAVVHGVVRKVGKDQDVESTLRRALEERRRRFEFTHFGVGASRGLVTLILVRRLANVRARINRQRLRVCVRLPRRSPVHRPRVVVTRPAGVHFERAVRGRRGCITVPARQRGRYQVEVMVDGRFGPEVAALFPAYVGVTAPRLPVHRLYPSDRREQGHVEIKLMHLLNGSRSAARLRALSPSSALASVARSHSQDMLVAGFFGHTSPRRGDLARRLARSGLSYRHAAENLAVTTRPQKAHESLMASPSHRRTILDPRATHVGVGVATDPTSGLLYVTQIVARLR